jgi:hypothetical protein
MKRIGTLNSTLFEVVTDTGGPVGTLVNGKARRLWTLSQELSVLQTFLAFKR